MRAATRATSAEYAEISFEQGLPVALNGEIASFHEIINAMNELAGKHGFGRIDMIENRLIGVKSREVYEVPGALTLIQAHKALEDLCLEREVLHYKLGVEQKWAELVYNGLWFSPLKEALDGFVDTTQKLVTGDVRLRFFKGSCVVVGRRSPYSLYDYNLATYDAADTLRPQGRQGLHRPVGSAHQGVGAPAPQGRQGRRGLTRMFGTGAARVRHHPARGPAAVRARGADVLARLRGGPEPRGRRRGPARRGGARRTRRIDGPEEQHR